MERQRFNQSKYLQTVEISVQLVITVPAQTLNLQITVGELLCLIRARLVPTIQMRVAHKLQAVLTVQKAFTASTMPRLLPSYAKKDGIAKMAKKSHLCLPTNSALKATTAHRVERQRVQLENIKIKLVKIVVILALMAISAHSQILPTT